MSKTLATVVYFRLRMIRAVVVVFAVFFSQQFVCYFPMNTDLQWMANGVIGKTGRHVRPRVEPELRNVSARVPSHVQLLAGKIVLVLVGRANHVKEYPVQVKSWFQY